MKKQKSASSRIFAYAIILYLIIAAVLACVFLLDAVIMPSGAPERLVRTYVGDKLIKSYRQEDYMFDGEMFLPVSVLSSQCGYVIAGDKESVSLVFTDSDGQTEQYAQFLCGTNSVIINGARAELCASSRFVDGELYVPSEFFVNYMTGLNCQDATLKNGNIATQISADSGSYGFALEGNSPDTALADSPLFKRKPKSTREVNFVADLSAYEQYMNPDDSEKYLLLVNETNLLPSDYAPETLTDLIHTRKDGRSTKQMEHTAAMAMEAMLKEAAANGYTGVSITSAYRPYSEQSYLFANRVRDYAAYGDLAESYAAKSVARPGTSEHQTGLCADLHNLPAASTAFAATAEFEWLYSHCADFGFILRYPKDKTDITKIMFEPWHYRYVGRYHATRIMNAGLCLEEYLEKYYSTADEQSLSENEDKN